MYHYKNSFLLLYTSKNSKSSSVPSRKLFFPSAPFRPLSSLMVSTVRWDHVVSDLDSSRTPLAPPMAPPTAETPLSVPGTHTSSQCCQQQPQHQLFHPPPSLTASPSATSCTRPTQGADSSRRRWWVPPAQGLPAGGLGGPRSGRGWWR